MKLIALFLALIFTSTTFAGAPLGVSGQQATSNFYPSVLQAPNNQVTDIGSGKGLFEHGNKNILVNPSFEHKTLGSGWTSSGTGTGSSESTIVIDGKKSYKVVMSAQTLNLSQSSTLYAAQFNGTVQGLAMVRVKSSVALSICAVQAGVVSTTLCVTTATDNNWGLYKIPFILSATSNGISIVSASATGTAYIDDAFVGAVDLKVDNATIGPWTSYSPTISGMGAVTSASFKWRQVGSNIQVSGTFGAGTVAASLASISLPNSYTLDSAAIPIANTTAANGLRVGLAQGNVANTLVNMVTATGTSTSLVYFGNVPSTATALIPQNGSAIWNSSVTSASAEFEVPITELRGSANNYSYSSAGYGWTAYTPTLTGQGTAVTGTLGGMYRKTGDSLEINIVYAVTTTGGSGATALEFTIPTGYTVNDTKARMLNGLIGHAATYNIPTLYAETPVATFNNKIRVIKIGTGVHITGADLASNSQIELKITLPVNELQDFNLIVGSFKEVPTTIGSSGSDFQSVYFGTGTNCATQCTTGTCSICTQVGSKITSVTWVSTGAFNINGIDGTKYICSGGGLGSGATYLQAVQDKASSTSSLARMIASTDLRDASINCIGIP